VVTEIAREEVLNIVVFQMAIEYIMIMLYDIHHSANVDYRNELPLHVNGVWHSIDPVYSIRDPTEQRWIITHARMVCKCIAYTEWGLVGSCVYTCVIRGALSCISRDT
jgi:hypothetical protein